jgi:hypothetical protein
MLMILITIWKMIIGIVDAAMFLPTQPISSKNTMFRALHTTTVVPAVDFSKVRVILVL